MKSPIRQLGTRPDFMILGYPVISFTTPYTHKGSLKNLLGDNPDPALVTNLSNELQVTAQTPPTFIFQTNADTTVPAENSVLFYLALRKAGIPREHEALGSQPSDKVREGHVLHVVRQGYRKGERILRPAQVIVASKPDGGPA